MGKEVSMGRARPKVAILILNWNGKRDTLETLESVRGLEYETFEVWLVDNGSTDDTLDVLRGYSGRLTWRSPPDSGQAEAVNRGFRLVRVTSSDG
jgi:glycosyltransferase involved in cell wall biosynthesis